MDHGYAWRREQHNAATVNPEKRQIIFYEKIAKKAAHQCGRGAVQTLRNYYTASAYFPENGSFSVKQLGEKLTETTGYNYTHREAIRRLTKQLQAAPAFFRETGPGVFSFRSKRAFLGYTRNNKEQYTSIDFNLLTKANNKQFTDLFIKAVAAGQKTATQNICNQTGFKRSRVFAAKASRLNIKASMGLYETQEAAEQAKREYFYKYGLVLDYIQTDAGLYDLQVIVGNSFNHISGRDTVSDGKGLQDLLKVIAELRTVPSIQVCNDKRETTTFIITDFKTHTAENIRTGEQVNYIRAEFKNDIAKQAFLSRRTKELQNKRQDNAIKCA